MFDEHSAQIVQGFPVNAETLATLTNMGWALCFGAVFAASALPGFADMTLYGVRRDLKTANAASGHTPGWVRKMLEWRVPKYWFRHFYEWGAVTSGFVFCQCWERVGSDLARPCCSVARAPTSLSRVILTHRSPLPLAFPPFPPQGIPLSSTFTGSPHPAAAALARSRPALCSWRTIS